MWDLRKYKATDSSWLMITSSFQKAAFLVTQDAHYSERAGRQVLVTKSSTGMRFTLRLEHLQLSAEPVGI